MKTESVIGTGVLLNGRVTWDDPRGFTRELQQLGDGAVACTVKPMSASHARSLRALGYWWGVVLAIVERETGQPADDIHAAMVERFVPSEATRIEFVNKLTGEMLPIELEQRHSPKSGEKFYQFVEESRQFFRDFLQIDTPDPDPAYWRKRDRKAA